MGEFYKIGIISNVTEKIPNISQLCFFIELAINNNKKDDKIVCWKYLLFNIQMCHKYYCAAAWLQRIFLKQTYPPDLHRSSLNLLQVMQNSRNVKVYAPRDKIPWG